MKAAGSFESLVSVHKTTRRHIPDDRNLDPHHCVNVRSQSFCLLAGLFAENTCSFTVD